jgi:hypothetical protein
VSSFCLWFSELHILFSEILSIIFLLQNQFASLISSEYIVRIRLSRLLIDLGAHVSSFSRKVLRDVAIGILLIYIWNKIRPKILPSITDKRIVSLEEE